MSELGLFQRNNAGILVRNGKIFLAGNQGGVTAEDLYNALQYSGLVTEDMTAEEMLAVLAAEYPEGVWFIRDGKFISTYNLTLGTLDIIEDNGVVRFSKSSAVDVYVDFPVFDVTICNKITVETQGVTTINDNILYYAEIYVMQEGTSNVGELFITNKNKSTHHIDVSNATGDVYVRVALRSNAAINIYNFYAK